MLDHLLRRLGARVTLTGQDAAAIRDLFSESRSVPAGEDIAREGAGTTVSVVLEGVACRYKTLADGRRQIVALHVPGEVVDLHGWLMGGLDYNVGALTRCKVAWTPHQKMAHVLARQPVLERALWKEAMVEGAVSRAWLVGVGRRSAYSRVAHMLCEVTQRLSAVSTEVVREAPLTQQEFADALGVSLVHVNRVLQTLRAEGLIALGRGAVKVRDWEGLKRAAEFDPAYLYDRHAAVG